MDTISYIIDQFRHLDQFVLGLVRDFGVWTYVILAAIVFVETGVVFMPFLPGDSLLFTAGAVAALQDSPISPHVLFAILASAAFIGDQCNYWIGKLLGARLIGNGNSRWIKKAHLDRTHAFFEKYGGKTIIMARFVPIVRTFAPFVAGVGAMTYRRFVMYDIVGAILWVGICTYAGVFFGQWDFVKKNFEVVVVAIILISVLPMAIELLRARAHMRRAAAATQSGENAPG